MASIPILLAQLSSAFDVIQARNEELQAANSKLEEAMQRQISQKSCISAASENQACEENAAGLRLKVETYATDGITTDASCDGLPNAMMAEVDVVENQLAMQTASLLDDTIDKFSKNRSPEEIALQNSALRAQNSVMSAFNNFLTLHSMEIATQSQYYHEQREVMHAVAEDLAKKNNTLAIENDHLQAQLSGTSPGKLMELRDAAPEESDIPKALIDMQNDIPCTDALTAVAPETLSAKDDSETIVFEVYGKIGVRYHAATGLVLEVMQDGRGKQLGIQEGWQALYLDDEPFSIQRLEHKSCREIPYRITFSKNQVLLPLPGVISSDVVPQPVPMPFNGAGGRLSLLPLDPRSMALSENTNAISIRLPVVSDASAQTDYSSLHAMNGCADAAISDDGSRKSPRIKREGLEFVPLVQWSDEKTDPTASSVITEEELLRRRKSHQSSTATSNASTARSIKTLQTSMSSTKVNTGRSREQSQASIFSDIFTSETCSQAGSQSRNSERFLRSPSEAFRRLDVDPGRKENAFLPNIVAVAESDGKKSLVNTESMKVNASSDTLRLQSRSDSIEDSSPLHSIAESIPFELTVGFIIVACTMVMALEAQYFGFDTGYAMNYPGSNSTARSTWPWVTDVTGHKPLARDWFDYLESVFGLMFTLLLLLKLYVLRHSFLNDLWNGFDSIIVFIFVLRYVEINRDFSPGYLRIIRILRLTRIARIFKTMQVFGSLRRLLRSFASGSSVVLWASALLVFVQLAVALLCTYLLDDCMNDPHTDIDVRHEVYKYFGSFSRSFLTTFQLIFGDWVIVTRVLSENAHELWAALAVLYKLAFGFGVIKVIAAMLLWETMRVAAAYHELMNLHSDRNVKTNSHKVHPLEGGTAEDQLLSRDEDGR
jgi:hypothetical protein